MKNVLNRNKVLTVAMFAIAEKREIEEKQNPTQLKKPEHPYFYLILMSI